MWWIAPVAGGVGALLLASRFGGRRVSSSGDPMADAATELGVSPEVLRGVVRVESGGRWSGYRGRPVVRLEAHHLERHNRGAREAIRERFRWNTSEPWRDQAMLVGGAWRPVHTGDQADEWTALELGSELAGEEAAHRASSWGAFQILGSNHKAAGYSSAVEMRRAYERGGSGEQVRSFVRFVRANKIDRYLRAGDWHGFAAKYNGPGQADYYAGRIKDAIAAERIA